MPILDKYIISRTTNIIVIVAVPQKPVNAKSPQQARPYSRKVNSAQLHRLTGEVFTNGEQKKW